MSSLSETSVPSRRSSRIIAKNIIKTPALRNKFSSKAESTESVNSQKSYKNATKSTPDPTKKRTKESKVADFQKSNSDQKFDKMFDAILNLTERFDNYEAKIDSLLQASDQHADLLDTHSDQIAEHHDYIIYHDEDITTIKHKIDRSNDEILIRGIPDIENPDYESILDKILSKIGFPCNVNTVVYETRDFPLQSPKNNTATKTKAFIACFLTPKIRDRVIKLHRDCTKFNYYDLFSDITKPTDIEIPNIFLNQILPSTVFTLLRETRKKLIPLGFKVWQYANKIYMRKDSESEPILISSFNDISNVE